MKDFWTALLLALILLISAVVLFAMALGAAYADEPNADCSYKPRQSDEVIVHCGSLQGKGSVSVRLCGINYAVEVNCK